MNFFDELKRRSVYKVAVAYAVVAWLLIQVATQVFPFLQIPDWAIRLVILLLTLGFPVALILAWAFELTPEGLKRSDEVVSSPTPKRRHAWIYIAVIGALLSLGLFFAGRLTAPDKSSKTSGTPEQSIAVLPFLSLSEDKANAYFADGIQDEILTRLSKIGGIKVISRTSTQQYQSKPGNLAEIAKQLGVTHVLEGSVQKAGESVRVNVQLIKAEGDSHLWADTFDRKLTDIFAVESEVAQRIADSLEAKLTGREKAAINYVGTKVPAAYDAYLHGIALRNSQARKDQTALIEYMRQAVALDPDYAAAWAELTFAQGLLFVQGERTEAQRAEVQTAAENTLRLDPQHGSGHAAMGMYLYYCLREYDQALTELFQAHEQAPNDGVILQAIGLVKRRQGKLDESVAFQLRAARLDPRNQDIWLNLGWSYRGMRRFADAHTMFARALALAPNDPDIIVRAAEVDVAQGNLATGQRLARELTLPLDGRAYGNLIYFLTLERKYDEVIAKLSHDLAEPEGRSLPPMLQATAEMTIGTMHLLAGRENEGRPFLLRTEATLKKLREEGNNSPGLQGMILGLHAWLGRREEVDREVPEHIAQQAIDRWLGMIAEEEAARAFVLVGENDRALALLERLAVTPYADCITPALLRLDPVWDKIRNDPRFQKISKAKP